MQRVAPCGDENTWTWGVEVGVVFCGTTHSQPLPNPREGSLGGDWVLMHNEPPLICADGPRTRSEGLGCEDSWAAGLFPADLPGGCSQKPVQSSTCPPLISEVTLKGLRPRETEAFWLVKGIRGLRR